MDFFVISVIINVFCSGVILNALVLLGAFLLMKKNKKSIILMAIISLVAIFSLLVTLIYAGDIFYIESLLGNRYLIIFGIISFCALILFLGYLLVKVIICYDKIISKKCNCNLEKNN